MSSGLLFVLWKGLLGFGLPIALGLWELHRLRRYRDVDAADGRSAFEPQAPVPPPPAPAAAPTRVRAPARERELELV